MKRIPRPIPEESGSLEPPRRNPPTAVATATPEPEDDEGRLRAFAARRQERREPLAVRIARRAVEAVLDTVLGELGDLVPAGMRGRRHR